MLPTRRRRSSFPFVLCGAAAVSLTSLLTLQNACSSNPTGEAPPMDGGDVSRGGDSSRGQKDTGPADRGAPDGTSPMDGGVSGTIGPKGGTIGSASLGAWLTVPAGALSHPVDFTIEPVATPFPGIVGQNYDIGPAGTVFARRATITLAYNAAELGGHSPSSYTVSYADKATGGWVAFSPPIVNAEAGTIGATTKTLVDLGIAPTSQGNCVDLGFPLDPNCMPSAGYEFWGCNPGSGGGAPANPFEYNLCKSASS
jgi:hypothetical protein